MKRTIRQHFVPQTYLKQFAFNPEHQKVRRVYALIKQRQIIVALPVQSVASRELFYDFTQNDQEQILENHLAKNVEGEFATLLRELTIDLKRRGTITQDQKRRLSPHLALQYLRTAEFRAGLEANLTAVRDMIAKQWKSRFPVTPLPKGPVQVEGELHFELGMNNENVRLIASILVQHSWRILRAPRGRSFLTSDVPVLLIGEPPAPWMGVGFASHGACVVFPLSPDFLVLTQDYRSFNENGHQGVDVVIPCTETTVDRLNGMIAAYGAEQVVGRDRQELERAHHFLQQHRT